VQEAHAQTQNAATTKAAVPLSPVQQILKSRLASLRQRIVPPRLVMPHRIPPMSRHVASPVEIVLRLTSAPKMKPSTKAMLRSARWQHAPDLTAAKNERPARLSHVHQRRWCGSKTRQPHDVQARHATHRMKQNAVLRKPSARTTSVHRTIT
jgi:hypothetical protein